LDSILSNLKSFLIRQFKVADKGILIVFAVIPAKAGIQYSKGFLDSRLRGSDGLILRFSNLLLGACVGSHSGLPY
jgi:hypothetical protein